MIDEVILVNEITGAEYLRKMAKVGKRDVLFSSRDSTHDEQGRPYNFSIKTINAFEKAEFLLEGLKRHLKEMVDIYNSECGTRMAIDEKALFVKFDMDDPRFQGKGANL